jgi:hypothetical protein
VSPPPGAFSITISPQPSVRDRIAAIADTQRRDLVDWSGAGQPTPQFDRGGIVGSAMLGDGCGLKSYL